MFKCQKIFSNYDHSDNNIIYFKENLKSGDE